MNIFQFGSHGNNIHHGTSFHNNLSFIFHGSVNNLLYTIYIGSKSCHNDSAVLMLCENQVKGSSYRTLRHGESGFFRIGGIGHHRQYSIFPQLRKTLQINLIAEYRRIIHLEVSGMNEYTCRRRNRKRSRILNGVIRLHEFHLDVTKAYALSILHGLHLYKLIHPIFHKLLLNQCQCQLGGINRNINLL